jgi:hypothetical protein
MWLSISCLSEDDKKYYFLLGVLYHKVWSARKQDICKKNIFLSRELEYAGLILQK